MKSRWIIGLGLVVAVAMSVVAASSAFAVRQRQRQLTLETAHGPLAAGAEIVATSSDLTTTTAAGALKCSDSVLTGKLRSVKLAQAGVSVREANATGGGPGGGCASPLGEAQITALNLPWTLTFNDQGVGVLRSTAGRLAFKSTFPKLGDIACVFEGKRITTRFSVGTRARRMELATSDQLFTRDAAASNAACPKSGEMSGHFKVTTSHGRVVLASI
jgi:hypothetical protein